jgi:hypothetical protein
MSEAAKRKVLQTEVVAYQELRGKIALRRTSQTVTGPAGIAPAPAPTSPRGTVVTPDMLALAVQDLKTFVRTEIDQLRRELRGGSRPR